MANPVNRQPVQVDIRSAPDKKLHDASIIHQYHSDKTTG
jgi:hypothetical protein